MFNTFFNNLLPKEPKFFPLLRDFASIIVDVSDLIVDCVKSKTNEEEKKMFRLIKEKERNADEISTRIFDALNQTFITPFDREDINHLANRMDDVVDNITSCSKRIALYNPASIPAEAEKLAEILKESAKVISDAVEQLGKMKKERGSKKAITDYCQELHTLENRADEIYENFVAKLFETETNAIEIIKNKEIVYELEKATDAMEHVGKIIKTIIVKYA